MVSMVTPNWPVCCGVACLLPAGASSVLASTGGSVACSKGCDTWRVYIILWGTSFSFCLTFMHLLSNAKELFLKRRSSSIRLRLLLSACMAFSDSLSFSVRARIDPLISDTSWHS